MVRFYLVPAWVTPTNWRGPKYFNFGKGGNPAALFFAPIEIRDYGREPSMLLAADLSAGDHAILIAQPDVTYLTDNLDAQVGARLVEIQNALEALNLPAQMINASTTYRTIVRGVTAIFVIAQCMDGKGFNVFAGGVTMNTTLGSLNAAARTALQDCADFWGYDRTGLTGASTVRQTLTQLASQNPPVSLRMMLGVSI